MSDSTFSVKVDDETRERVRRLQEDAGISSKDFFRLLLEQHELTKLQEAGTRHKELINLQHHLSRVEAIFVGVINDGQDQAEAAAQNITELTQQRTEAQAALTTLRNDHNELVKIMETDRDMLVKQLAQADKDKTHYERLADLSQAAEAGLKDQVAALQKEVEHFPEERAQLHDELTTAQNANVKFRDQLADMQGDLKRTFAERENDKRAYELELERLKKAHSASLDAMKDKSALNLEAAVLGAREAAQKRLEEARTEDFIEIKRLLAENAALKDQVAELLRAENAALKGAKK